ncbi:pyridoxal phosphate-dependent aminotransferase [bacterium]|nr:pyridoxal phosphate-dependent aminotransferase [candidate division CSSED10-310 bacterium]
MLSKLISNINPSVTLGISAKAKSLKKQGKPIINLSVGEPDFNTPENIKTKAKDAIEANQTRYTQADGIPELKTAIAQRLKKDDKVDYQPNQIIVSPGAKASIFLALAAIVNPGDEIIIPTPFWVSYPEQVKLVGGNPIYLKTTPERHFLIDPPALQSLISPRTRAILLNNPCNPTGAAYDIEHLMEILNICTRHNLYIVADEIYSKIVFDGFKFVRCAGLSQQIYDRTITIDGVSKAYAMTGWRIGYAAGPQEIIAGMKSFQEHLTSNPCSIAQYAALEAFSGDQRNVAAFTEKFQERRDVLHGELLRIPGIRCTKPKGTFYIFPDISEYFDTSDGQRTIRNSIDLADYLLDTAQVATVPGDGFGAERFLRLSFAASLENLNAAVRQIGTALGALGKM